MTLSSPTLYFYSNNKRYTMLTTYGPLLGMWGLNMTNGFILKDDLNVYSLLLFMNKDYVKARIEPNLYWNESPLVYTMPGYDREIENITDAEYIVPFHHTLLSLMAYEDAQISAVYASLWLAQNNIAMTLFLPNMRLLENPAEYIFFFRGSYFPFWPLEKGGRELELRSHVLSFRTIDPFTASSSVFDEIRDIPQYKIMKDFTDKFYI